MANFMGPMAPPQAAPNAPPQLDIRTNPGQRAQFKSFMQDMNRPVMPPTTAPIAPMLPAPMPSPMDQIDIFAPAPMASGGVVGGLNKLNQMSDQMVEALNAVVYGGDPGGGGFGGGIGGPMSSGGGFGGGQMPAPLPPITAAPVPPTPPNPSGPTFGTRPNEFNRTPGIGGGSGPVIDTFALPDNYVGNPAPNIPASNLEDRILSLNDSALLGMPTPSYMPMDPDGDGMDQQGRPMESQLTDAERMQAERDQQDRITSLRSRLAEGSAFGSGSMGSPLARLGGLGSFGSVFGYEDGGAVGMQRGGGVRMAGGTTNLIDRSTQRGPREDRDERAIIAARGEDPGEEAGIDLGIDLGSAKPSENFAALNAALSAELLGMSQDFRRPERPIDIVPNFTSNRSLGVDSQQAPDLVTPYESGGPSIESIIARNARTTQGFRDLYDSMSDVSESDGDFAGVAPVTAPPVDMPGADPMNDLLFGEGRIDVPIIDPRADRDSVTPMEQFYLDQEAKAAAATQPSIDQNLLTSLDLGPNVLDTPDPLGLLMSGDVVYNRGKDNERTLDRLADLENRMGVKRAFGEGEGLSGLAEPIMSKIASATGGAMATKVFDNVVNQNKQPIIAADTNQIVGYADDGPFGRVYTGQPDYNPFGAEGQPFTVDPQTGALIVQRKSYMDNVGRPTSDDPVSTLPPADGTEPPATPPPLMVTRPDNPLVPTPPPDVVVPSPRDPVTIQTPSLLPPLIAAPNIAPVQGAGLPQSFLDLLASFNRPAPRAMQDGGAVLDQAAGNFLEALKVA